MPISVKYTRSWVRFFCSIHLVSAVWLYSTVHRSSAYGETIADGGAARARFLQARIGVGANERLLDISFGEVLYLLRALWVPRSARNEPIASAGRFTAMDLRGNRTLPAEQKRAFRASSRMLTSPKPAFPIAFAMLAMSINIVNTVREFGRAS